MGNLEKPYIRNDARPMSLPSGAFVVSDAETLHDLLASSAGRPTLDLRRVELALDEELPDEVIEKSTILVLQADPLNARSMARIHALRSARPFMPLIVALRDADIATTRSLIREGVNDVVSIPFDYEQLCTALLDASVEAEKSNRQELPLAPLYTIIGSSGGVGATTIATHLAGALADRRSETCCILDFDIQFGTTSAYLGASDASTVQDLIAAENRLDVDLLRSVASEVGNGLAVIPAPREITPFEHVDVDQALKVLKLARQEYGSVVLDLPTNITNWSLSAVLDSTVVLMVVDLTVTSLKQARRRLDLLIEMEFDPNRLRTVVNRVEKGLFKTVKLEDAERVLRAPVLGSVINEPALVTSAQNQGKLLPALHPRHAFSKDIDRLCDELDLVDAEN